MARPSDFFVAYEDTARFKAAVAKYGSEPDPVFYAVDRNFTTLAEARRFAARHASEYPRIYRRKNFVDVTPACDPPGLLWDYEEEMIDDIPAPEVSG